MRGHRGRLTRHRSLEPGLPAQGGKRGVLEALEKLDGPPGVKFRRAVQKEDL